MPKGQDFKRLVRARMDHTGERYTRPGPRWWPNEVYPTRW
jgi:hypothetical protein